MPVNAKRYRAASKTREVMPLVIAGLVLVAGIVGVVVIQRAAKDRADAERARIAEERALAAEKPAPIIYVTDAAPAAPKPAADPAPAAPAHSTPNQNPLVLLLEQASKNLARDASQVDPAYVAETLKLFRELRSRTGFAKHMGRPEKHEAEGDKIERQLTEVEAHLRKQQVTHDEAIQARDTGYRLDNGYDIWTMSMEPREEASPSERSVIYGMRDRIRSRTQKINSALSHRASQLDQAATDRAEADWLGQTAPSAPAKPASACDWCNAESDDRKLIEEEGPAKGMKLCDRCRAR